MCIYNTKRINYRKIWEQHYGPIPYDENGLRYEIHHIDGDHTNNDITNLICIPIHEHYNIHKAQGDYGACLKIAKHIKISSEERSEIAKKSNMDRINAGTHNFLNSDQQRKKQLDQLEKGTHLFQTSNFYANRSKIIEERGTHNMLGGEIQQQRVAEGRHNFQNKEWSRQAAIKRNAKLLDAGLHPNQIKWCCLLCKKEGVGIAQFAQHQTRWHR